MPNNYLVETDAAALAKQLGARWQGAPTDTAWLGHVFPKYQAPVVIWSDGERLLRPMQFGFFPPFAKDQKTKPIHNARWETLVEKPTFRGPFLNTRCSIPLTGFFEHCEPPQTPKWFGWFAPKDGRMAVAAGLWTSWRPSGGTPIDLFTLITRDAPEDLLRLGLERMPVCLPPKMWDRWLDPAQHDATTLQQILAQFDPFDWVAEQRTPPSRKKGSSGGGSSNLTLDLPFEDDDE